MALTPAVSQGESGEQMITFNCTCGKKYSVDDKLSGRRAKCKACGAEVTVPAPQVSAMDPLVDDISAWLSEGKPDDETEQQTSSTATNKESKAAASTSAKKKPPPRMRRLVADANMLATAFKEFPLIKIRKREGNPPDLYQIAYKVRGLVRGPDGNPIYRESHVAEIQLTRDYPRQSPKCRMLTPIFHPNIEPATICVGDHWTAGERLVDLVIRIGEMIAYQAYNIKSPLDGDAAMWADKNPQHLPVDHRDLRPPDLD